MDLYAQMGIKSQDVEKILDVINSYYNKYDLALVEEKIGNHQGKYVNSPKTYIDLNDYDQQQIGTWGRHVVFSTNFDLFSHLENNPDWTIFQYYPYLAESTVNLHKDLANTISEHLNIPVFEIFEYDTTNQIVIRNHENGFTKDELASADTDIYGTSGYFEQFEDISYESMEQMCDIRNNFFEYIDFKPYTVDTEQNNAKTRHPMYLKGAPEKIISFLASQETF